MDRTQADAAADAILEPHLREQQARREEIEAKRATDAAEVARKRRVAAFALVGCAIGALAAFFVGLRIAQGIIWGGLAGAVLGGFFTLFRKG